MPRSTPLRPFALAAALALVAVHAPARAQDPAKVAGDANKNLKDIQKKLAAGKTADDKDNPNLKRLRVDAFAADGQKVRVTGVFIDPGAKPNGDAESQVGDAAKELILKHLGVTGNVAFAWDGVKSVGVLDDAGRPKGEPAPHVAVQAAANGAGAKGKRDENRPADRVLVADSGFGPAGELVLVGYRDDDPAVETWLSDEGAKALAANPAAVRGKGDKPQASFASVAKVKTWALTPPAVQKILVGSTDAAFRRVRADRVYFSFQGADPKLTVAGVRIGEDKFVETALQDSVRQLWPEVLGGTKPVRIAVAPEIVNGLVEPTAALRAAVAAERALDGVRVDPGAEFDAAGEVALAGLRPDLSEAQRDKLDEVFQAVLKPLRTKGDAAAPRYELLAAGKVSAGRMKRIPVAELRDDLAAWAVKTKDDIRIRRLYFADDPKALTGKSHVVATHGAGLVLVYQVADAKDAKAVEAKFTELFDKRFPEGIPGVKVAAPAAPDGGAANGLPPFVAVRLAVPHAAPQEPKDKEGRLAGLTAEIRRIVASDPKKWYGVLIERGYFDKDDRYTLAGVVDNKEQNAQLAELFKELRKDPKWAEYFSPEPNPPALRVIPMGEMVTRVKRVTPAYSEFDRVRIESARYDAQGNLVFEAHVLDGIAPEAPVVLAKLLRESPTYKYRAPADKRVLLVKAKGAPDWDEQASRVSTGFAAQFLAKGEPDKAKEWIDAALMHHPNVSAVWFLSAYYNVLKGDSELVSRDLQRVVELEGPLSFNGPEQRRRRYQIAKDIQGPKRIALETAWLERFNAVKEGAAPITLDKK